MKVLLKQTLIGKDGARAGREIDLPESEAKRLIKANYAEAIEKKNEKRSKGNSSKRKSTAKRKRSKNSSKSK